VAVGIVRLNAACCGSTEYDPASQGCCNGAIYNLASQGCCNGAIYDLATEECCGGQIVEKGQCCNDQPLPEGQECCKKVSPEAAYDPAVKCCETAGLLPKTPIANLDDCPSRVAIPNYTPPQNGCGSDWSHYIVPDSFPPGTAGLIVSFTDACKTHDTCYGTCRTTTGAKGLCDTILKLNMETACYTQLPQWVTDYFPAVLTACYNQADVYYYALADLPYFSDSAWNDAQKAGCQCCP